MVQAIFEVDATDTFWEKVAIQAVGPLVTVLIGGLVVWGVTYLIQESRDAKLRTRAEARANAEIDRDRRARDDALRHELVTRLTEAAGPLYLMTQHYWRAKREASNAPANEGLKAAKEAIREKLDEQYLRSRASGEALEFQLKGYFENAQPCEQWHRVQDLLTVRYFQLVDGANDNLYRENEGEGHTGLKVDQMKNPKNVLDGYRREMRKLIEGIFKHELSSRSRDETTG